MAHVSSSDMLGFHKPGLCNIFNSIVKSSSTTDVREPLTSGRACINIILNNIGNTTDLASPTFKDIAATCYTTNSTGINNGIFATYGVQL